MANLHWCETRQLVLYWQIKLLNESERVLCIRCTYFTSFDNPNCIHTYFNFKPVVIFSHFKTIFSIPSTLSLNQTSTNFLLKAYLRLSEWSLMRPPAADVPFSWPVLSIWILTEPIEVDGLPANHLHCWTLATCVRWTMKNHSVD